MMSTLENLIKSRRSIFPRMFSEEIIEDEKIEQLLEAANWAPTHKLTEPWRFTVFKGDGLKKLAQFQQELYKTKAEKSGNFDEVLYKKLGSNPLNCSHVIGIGVKISGKVPEIEETNAVACAVQNILLTATELELGCYWGSGGITYFEEAKPFFGLDPEDKFMGFLFLGKLKGNLPEGRRKPIAEKVKWVS